MTMNMPSASSMLVHQITVELPEVKSCKELCELMNDQEFIIGRQYYKYRGFDNVNVWEDRGNVIVNTAHIGKIQEFYETEGYKHDESHRSHEPSRSHAEVKRGPIRPR